MKPMLVVMGTMLLSMMVLASQVSLNMSVESDAHLNLIDRLSSFQKQHIRRKRSNDECGSGCQPSEIECCPMNVVIEYPVSGLSAITNERMHIVQVEPIYRQPVLKGLCVSDQSSILDAQCKQLYVPVMMAVARNDAKMSIKTNSEPILVEFGCDCQLNPTSSQVELYNGPDIDDLAKQYLSMWRE